MKNQAETAQIVPIASNTPCANCGSEIQARFCGNCGQPSKLPRVDAHYVLHEIQHVLHFEKGILYTIRELLIRPGKNVREFISDNRSRLVKPILFLVLTSLVYTIINNLFHVEQHMPKELQHTISAAMLHWFDHHMGYTNLMMGIFIATWLKVIFRKTDYNFFELLILLCFVMGVGMLFSAVFALAGGLMKLELLTKIGMVLSPLYCFWAIALFFNRKTVKSYLKVLFAYLLGMVSFSIVVIILGVILDLIRIALT